MDDNRPKFTHSKAAGDAPLYSVDEQETLRGELLEAYSTAREKMVTRDQVTEMKRNQFAYKETHRQSLKKEKDEDIILQLKAKQDALRRLFENVLRETRPGGGKKRRPKKSGSGSFHEMYTVYHDPTSGNQDKKERGALNPQETHDDAPFKVLGTTIKPEPPKEPSNDGRQKTKSKFVFRAQTSKAGHLLSKGSISKELPKRKDVRLSEDHDRYSFAVDVRGPFVHRLDPNRKLPPMRNIGTQAKIADGTHDIQSQTDMEMTEWDPKRFSLGTEHESDADEDASAGGGDASSSRSSNPSERGDIDDEEDKVGTDFGKELTRKESKRREAETMARPRGYRDLDLNQKLPYISFEAETNVTAYDLEREMAKQRGFVLSRDNILWPTCHEFDIDIASRKIEDYIKRCWNLDSKWLFFVQPIEVYHDNYRKKYIFEVKFSVPTPATPVPQATASVFFVFEIPMYATREDKIKIHYVLEGMRFAHSPGRLPFQDKWLWGIITDKLRVQKAANI